MPVITERYEAIVSSIEDTDKRGQIEVICPALMGDYETPLPQLADPAPDWGWFYIPDVGEQVEIEVVVSSDRDESFGQAALEALAPVWRSKRFYSLAELEDDADGSVPRPIHDDFKATNYGKRRGFCTPWGHVFLFDDTDGDPRIYLTHMGKQLEPGKAPQPADYTRIEIEPDGSLRIGFLDTHLLHFTTEKGNIKIELDNATHTLEFDADTPKVEVKLANGDHNMTLDPDKFTANLGGGASLKVELKDADTKMTVGDGAKHVAIVEHLQSLYESLKSEYDAHTHQYNYVVVSGGSGAPAVGTPVPTPSDPPASPAPGWDGNINSTHVSIPDV